MRGGGYGGRADDLLWLKLYRNHRHSKKYFKKHNLKSLIPNSYVLQNPLRCQRYLVLCHLLSLWK